MRHVSLWGPVVAVMALIFFASSLTLPGPPPAGMSDKSAHFIVYGALGGALLRALADGRPAAATVRRVLIAFALATLYGATDELHQRFVPNRTPDLLDVYADAAGALLGAILMAGALRVLGHLRPSRAWF